MARKKRRRKGRMPVILLGLSMVLVSSVLGIYWKHIYYTLYPDELLIGKWRVDVDNASMAAPVTLDQELVAKVLGALGEEAGLTLGFKRDGALFLWWGLVFSEDNQPDMRYTVEGNVLIFHLSSGVEERYRKSFQGWDRLVLEREYFGVKVRIPFSRLPQ